MNYNQYIRNKKVIFIGASPIIKGDAQGEFYDSFDIIVKTNGSMFLKGEEYYRDYGSRIDILYTNNQFYREHGKDIFNANIKYLRMKTCRKNDLEEYRKYFNANIINEAIKIVNRYTKSALMGCYILQDILLNKPEKLYITGIDFFVSKKQVFEENNYQEYIDGYLTDKIIQKANVINQGKKEDGHNQYSNTKFIFDLYEKGLIEMPKKIKNLMYKVIENKGYINDRIYSRDRD